MKSHPCGKSPIPKRGIVCISFRIQQCSSIFYLNFLKSIYLTRVRRDEMNVVDIDGLKRDVMVKRDAARRRGEGVD